MKNKFTRCLLPTVLALLMLTEVAVSEAAAAADSVDRSSVSDGNGDGEARRVAAVASASHPTRRWCTPATHGAS